LIWFHISVNYGDNGLGHDMYFYHVSRLGCGRMVVGFITTYAISTYHH